MPIKPKYVIGELSKEQYIPKKKFTDRFEQKDAFFSLIEAITSKRKNTISKHYVLNYYGLGGIGKSALIKEIQRLIGQSNEIVYLSADLANVPTHNPVKLLLELSHSISNENILFYHFGLAYAIYFQKSNKDVSYKSDLKQIVSEELGFVAEILSIFDGLGILGVIPGAVNRIYDYSYKKLHLDDNLKNDLKNLEKMEPARIGELLPAFFAYDLKKYMRNNLDKQFVVFLDSYETLWSDELGNISRQNKENIIHELISNLQDVLFTICSREKLNWESADSEWADVIKYKLIEFLPKHEADVFLLECGVEEQNIRDMMINVSFGHPYHLSLLVDTYYSMVNSNIIPKCELFASNARTILECFLKYLKQNEIALLKILSLTRFYDFDLFNFLTLKFPTGFPITMFDKFNSFSFVTAIGNGLFKIHDIMKNDLIGTIPISLINSVHFNIAQYYHNRFCDTSTTFEHRKEFAKECIFHLKQTYSKEEFVNFITTNYFEYFLFLQNKGETKYLVDVLDCIFNYIKPIESIELFGIYTDMIMLSGNFKEAVVFLDNFLKNYNLNQISSDESLLQLYVKKIKHQMIYTPLTSTIETIDNILPFINPTYFPHQYSETIYTKGNMMMEQGNYREALDLLLELYEFSNEYSLNDMLCRICRKISDCYLILGNVYKSNETYNDGMRLANNYSLERYGSYLDCTKAEIYRKLKLFEEAKKIYSDNSELFLNRGIMPWVAHTKLGIAEIYIEQSDYDLAMQYLLDAERIYVNFHHEWGKIHTNVLKIQLNYLKTQQLCEEEMFLLKKKCIQFGYNSMYDVLTALESGVVKMTSILFL